MQPEFNSPEKTCRPSEPPDSTDQIHLPRVTWYDPYKAAAEYFLTAVLFCLAFPIMVFCALLVKLTSPGPAFYSQTRLGRNGRAYTIYKLRSMRHNCERESGVCWSTAGDSRVTRLGRFLRDTHLDELPQLWNVLRGDMSLVGPRPERPEFFPQLEESLPFYRSRLLVRPGVSGLAQVQLPADTDLESVRLKLSYDLYYVQHRNPWLDLRVIVATTAKMVGVPYRRITKLLCLPRGEVIETAYRSLTSDCRPPLQNGEPGAELTGPESVEVAIAFDR